MKKLAGNIYRLILPLRFRQQLSLFLKNDDTNKLRKEILHFYKRVPAKMISEEKKEVIAYLKKNPLSIFPYSFSEKYDYRDVKVFSEDESGLKYVLMEGKRLYFKRKWSEDLIKGYYSFLQMEQDIESPHRYLTNNFFVGSGDVVADIGSAEGTFALSVVEKADKIFLFETDEDWVEALEATFAPWKEKVEIINKFVSDKNDDRNISLDSFFKNKRNIDFLKVDVEGTEAELLKGCEKVLSSRRPFKLVICTYHKHNDEFVISELLKNYGFTVSFSNGYMVFIKDKEIKLSYLRRGLIRAEI